jgi:hypothetical protein
VNGQTREGSDVRIDPIIGELTMTRPGGTTIPAMDETEASALGADVPNRKISQREAVKRVRAGETFRVGRVRIPTPANLGFYGGLALLVAAKYIDWPLAGHIGIDWPIAVVIALGHALTSRQERTSKETAAATAAAIDQLRTEIRRLDEMLRRNGEGDQVPGTGSPSTR